MINYTPAVYFSAAVEATEFQRLSPQLDPEAGAMQGKYMGIGIKPNACLKTHTTQPVITQYKMWTFTT